MGGFVFALVLPAILTGYWDRKEVVDGNEVLISCAMCGSI